MNKELVSLLKDVKNKKEAINNTTDLQLIYYIETEIDVLMEEIEAYFKDGEVVYFENELGEVFKYTKTTELLSHEDEEELIRTDSEEWDDEYNKNRNNDFVEDPNVGTVDLIDALEYLRIAEVTYMPRTHFNAMYGNGVFTVSKEALEYRLMQRKVIVSD